MCLAHVCFDRKLIFEIGAHNFFKESLEIYLFRVGIKKQAVNRWTNCLKSGTNNNKLIFN